MNALQTEVFGVAVFGGVVTFPLKPDKPVNISIICVHACVFSWAHLRSRCALISSVARRPGPASLALQNNSTIQFSVETMLQKNFT